MYKRQENFSAFGRFPGGFTKRDGRASDYEILTCRLVDRALRPLFPDNFHAEEMCIRDREVVIKPTIGELFDEFLNKHPLSEVRKKNFRAVSYTHLLLCCEVSHLMSALARRLG